MIRDHLLAIGLVLAAESQLRISGLPFGAGEACLLLWIFLAVTSDGIGRAIPTRAFWAMVIFWALFSVAQCIGTVWGVAAGAEIDRDLFIHDVIAYMLLGPLSCLMVMKSDATNRLHQTARGFVAFGTASLAVQFIQAMGLISIPFIDPWFWERFRGWSANPNQLGLFCAILGLLAVHMADTATHTKGRLAWTGCLVLPLIVGRMTGSDTFTLTALAAGPVFILMKLMFWIRFSGRQHLYRSASVRLIMMTVPVFLLVTVPLAISFAGDPERSTLSLAKNNGKDSAQEADLRLSLWYQALQTSLQTGLLGLGPGPHLTIPDSIISAHASTAGEPDNVAHPTQGAAPNFEAHNTLLDLLTQGGLIAVISVVWLHAKAFAIGYRARSAGLVALISGICLFGMTGLIIRHPMYWFVLSLCLIGQVETDGQAGPKLNVSQPCERLDHAVQ